MPTNKPIDLDRVSFHVNVDLAGGRFWLTYIEDPRNSEDVPRLLIDQFPDEDAMDQYKPTGSIWFGLDDLPQIIQELKRLSATYQEHVRQQSAHSTLSPSSSSSAEATRSRPHAPEPMDVSRINDP